MLSKELQNTYQAIVNKTAQMVYSHIDRSDLTGVIDYASIYAQSREEFAVITKELQANGSVAIERPTGSYYVLNQALETPGGAIRHCRVRLFDADHPERGYADFETTNYAAFKEKYLPRPHFSLLAKDEEMIELRDPNFNVRAYFPSGSF
ncbi:MAG: hypothetical protein NUV98_06220 [Candidatus Roizmanbacteria bacterium]|nr:hypothetical protein [Candidatus Roizmanbacteria bacterium]